MAGPSTEAVRIHDREVGLLFSCAKIDEQIEGGVGCVVGSGVARSILLTTTTTLCWSSRALRSTNRVWGIGPSTASTSSNTPSTMFKTRSTSPPKSACPGVSTILIFTLP